MYTTLNKIRECSPCTAGWGNLLNYLGKIKPDDESLSLLTILDSDGVYNTLWCFRAVEGFEKEKLLLAITYAREVEHLMPAESKKALDVFDRYANGLATQEEFQIARKAAADVSYAAWIAAYAAAYANAADTAVYAAWSAARAADAAAHATEDAARAAADAYVYAYSRTRTRARSAIEDKQETQLRELLEKTCTQP